MMAKPLVTMTGINKHFPGVLALDGVDFQLVAGEIHALMGENGAGKSTLVKVLTGAEAFESGQIKLDGFDAPIINHSPQEAQERGLATVYQEVNLAPNLSVAENLFVARQPRRLGLVNWRAIHRRAEAILAGIGLDIDVDKPLESYPIAVQQMVAIGRAIDVSAKVLILDEPTSSLNDQEVANLFALMRRLRDQGLGIIFISHFLEQVYEVCDRITVLRNGRLVGQYDVAHLARRELVSAMLGRSFDDLAALSRSDQDQSNDTTPVVRARGLAVRGGVKPFDLDIMPGEVVGLAGLLGSGRTQVARVIFAADPADQGTRLINNRQLPDRPLDSVRAGLAFCPESRKDEGVIGELSVRENIVVAQQSKLGAFHLMSHAEQVELAQHYIDLLQIKCASMETPIKQLSGGNQQKVILARWLATHPELLILDEPTRGIDIGTKAEIQRLCLELADQGMAVLFISSEIDEMLRTCSRIGVMRDLEKVGELTGDQLNSSAIMAAIAGGEADD
ncbi:MAG: sugar ABC transporter ATP-binding protein [Propionibacteriaceae bacterium]|jgi:simple sugar transport system ATP-binding protein|nr:sugar ABC transporter ATP-binding protein [Propionibacteriaceae bacterium]